MQNAAGGAAFTLGWIPGHRKHGPDQEVGQPDHRFRCTKHEKAVRFGRLGKAIEDVDLGVLIEVDQNVPAEDHVEDPELGKIVQQIQLPVLPCRDRRGPLRSRS